MHQWGASQIDHWIDWLRRTIAIVETEPERKDARLRVVGGELS